MGVFKVVLDRYIGNSNECHWKLENIRRVYCNGCRIIIVLSTCVSATGCGTTAFSERESNPMIQDTTTAWIKPFWNDRNIDVFATTASRRTVIVLEDKRRDVTEICAEPPPDVGEAFSAAVTAGLQGAVSAAQGSDTRLGVTIAGQFARQVATQIAPLLYRTQGLQLLRDSQYTLCIDRMSGYQPVDEVRRL